MKQVTFNDEARLKLKEGVDILAKAVKTTLGPKGRNVVISTYGKPQLTKDGVTVAKNIELEDQLQNQGAQMVKQAAEKTVEQAGDGTTTATVLAQAMVAEGTKLVQSGANPIDLKRGMDKAAAAIVKYLQENTIDIKGDVDRIKQVATVSANNDEDIGTLIASAISQVGDDGVITVDESKSTETYIKKSQGTRIDRGFTSPYFITDPEKQTAEHEDVLVYITDQKLKAVPEILPVLEIAAEKGKPLLVIADEIEAQALSLMVVNRMRTNLPVVAIKAPAFGDRRGKILQDLAILTGATVISDKAGISLTQVKPNHLGNAGKVIVSKTETTIIDGKGDKKSVDKRIKDILAEAKNATSGWEQEKAKERAASMTGGIAVLYVGAPTELELKEKKDRIDDALQATQAALIEGIQPGGGVAYLKADKTQKKPKAINRDEELGIELVSKAIQSPIKAIAENAGVSGEVVVANVLGSDDYYWGYNARTDEYENLVDTGILDPTRVLRVALQNAVSVASMILMTEVSITDIKKEVPPYEQQGF